MDKRCTECGLNIEGSIYKTFNEDIVCRDCLMDNYCPLCGQHKDDCECFKGE